MEPRGARDYSHALIMGAGLMGRGIAVACALGGLTAFVYDADRSQVSRARAEVEKLLARLAADGIVATQAAEAALHRIALEEDWQGVAGQADVVIECVYEDLPLKREVFRQLAQACPPETLLATNTSGLSLTAIAEAIKDSDRVVGMHWVNPPYLVPLVEIIRSAHTAEWAFQAAWDLALRLGKRPIRVNQDVPGFVVNRLQFALYREALHLIRTGVATPEDIDAAIAEGAGLRWAFLGPLQVMDLGGLDTFLAICEYLFPALCSDSTPVQVLREKVQEGALGAKTGRGFYHYPEPESLAQWRDRCLGEILAIRGRLKV